MSLGFTTGSARQLIVSGSGFTANSTVTVTLTLLNNGVPLPNSQSLSAQSDGLGLFSVMTEGQCPVGQATAFRVVAHDAAGRGSNTAGASC
jgi:hypothetical protein